MSWLARACARFLGRRPSVDAGTRKRRTRGLRPIEAMEDRRLLSVNVVVDYSLDTGDFFNTQAKRDVMQAAANTVGAMLNTSLGPIASSGSNTWSEVFPGPSTGQMQKIPNPSVPANTLIVYVAGRALPGTEVGEGATGGWSASGSPAWLATVATRGHAGSGSTPPTDFTWGGSISFSPTANFYFGQDIGGIVANQTDFYSTALHELGHVIGLGTGAAWKALESAGDFIGSHAEAANGGAPVPLGPGGYEWLDGTTSGGAPAVEDPVLANGTRWSFTPLDLGALQDIGWNVQAPASPVAQPVASPPTVQFSQPSYTVEDVAGNAIVNVTRTGSTYPVTVHYAVTDGTGKQGLDYAMNPDWGVLSFAEGQTSASLTIPVLDDPAAHGGVTVNLNLNSPGGGAILGASSTAVLTINPAVVHPVDDFDGVGITERAVFQPATAQWIINAPQGQHSINFGAPNLADIPVPGDYDGTGRTELAVFRPATAQWFILNPNGSQRIVNFGAPNLADIPVPGDYDGTGRTELAVFRPSTAQWFILNPNGSQRIINFGAPNLADIPVPGDYDGTGRTELAVFRPATAQWFILNPNGSQRIVNFGVPNLSDIPISGDFDGVGHDELGVYRPSTGQWITDDLLTGTQHVADPGWTGLAVVPVSAPVAALSALGVVEGPPTSSPAPTVTTSTVTSSVVVKRPVHATVAPINWGSAWLKAIATLQATHASHPRL